MCRLSFSDVEIAKLEKRRKRLRERSPSPIPPLDETPSGGSVNYPRRQPSPLLPLPSVPPHLNRLPESHAKIMYMSAIGLARATEDQKLVHEIVWSAILDDRLARGDHNSTINTYFTRLRDMPVAAAAAVGGGSEGPRSRTPAGGPIPSLGSLLPPPPADALVGTNGGITLPQSPLNIPQIHCGGGGVVKEEAGGVPLAVLHLVKLEAGLEACGYHNFLKPAEAVMNFGGGRLVVKSEPEELTMDMKRRLEEYDEPLMGADLPAGSPAKRRPPPLQQQQQVGGGGGEVDGGLPVTWPGVKAIEQAYRKHKEG